VAASKPRRIGHVVHYYDHAGAGVISLSDGELRVGDTIHVRGHTTDFYQRVERLERDHEPVQVARVGEEVAVQVSQRVREGDELFVLES
jgi:translation initiation factor IF-2